MKFISALLVLISFLSACQNAPVPEEKSNSTSKSPAVKKDTLVVKETLNQQKAKTLISYQFKNPKQWLEDYQADSMEKVIAYAVNRTDETDFLKMDSVLIPNTFEHKLAYYLPFPLQVNYIKDVSKLIYFSYPTQTFAAYEKGELIYTGPTSMGRKELSTPTGLFFTNWKARVATST
ncbi:MAG: L,D-transpeptidase, partial [Bacteroidia bacterium]